MPYKRFVPDKVGEIEEIQNNEIRRLQKELDNCNCDQALELRAFLQEVYNDLSFDVDREQIMDKIEKYLK